MFLYKNLKFDYVPEITQQLLDIAQEFNPNLNITKVFDCELIKTRVPKLYSQFVELDLHPEIFREYVSQPFAGIRIHHDGTPEFPKYLALNWPIFNCENTRMIWWQLDPDAPIDVKTVDGGFEKNNALLFYSEKYATKLDEHEIVSPTLVNVREYHSVENGPNIRRMVSFRFKPEPTHLLN